MKFEMMTLGGYQLELATPYGQLELGVRTPGHDRAAVVQMSKQEARSLASALLVVVDSLE